SSLAISSNTMVKEIHLVYVYIGIQLKNSTGRFKNTFSVNDNQYHDSFLLIDELCKIFHSESLNKSIHHFKKLILVRRGPRTVQSETKYVELLVVNDYELMRRSTPQTRNFAKAVVNMADIYKEQLNTRIVLVAMETWSTQNMVSVGDDPLVTLRDFMKYRKENIKEKSDAAHLLSGRTFQSRSSGTAYIEGICSPTRGGGVNEYGNVGPMAITLCQSLGQNLGMMWNKDRATAGDCKCPDPWLGCIMEDTG
uniref:Peptidase M12B domain-containing protein n=1 Tax=Sinocyclocheilus anshuiensis TaxID=1608454 RepID=A0A671NLD1_9TELE